MKDDIHAWAVTVWNATVPAGTEVILVDDFGDEERTKTRTPAWQLGHGHPVVSVDGRSGGYRLYRIRPVTEEEPK